MDEIEVLIISTEVLEMLLSWRESSINDFVRYFTSYDMSV